jgi:hypothetical protein
VAGPLAPGGYLVLATAPGGRRALQRVRLDGQPRRELTLTLEP